MSKKSEEILEELRQIELKVIDQTDDGHVDLEIAVELVDMLSKTRKFIQEEQKEMDRLLEEVIFYQRKAIDTGYF